MTELLLIIGVLSITVVLVLLAMSLALAGVRLATAYFVLPVEPPCLVRLRKLLEPVLLEARGRRGRRTSPRPAVARDRHRSASDRRVWRVSGPPCGHVVDASDWIGPGPAPRHLNKAHAPSRSDVPTPVSSARVLRVLRLNGCQVSPDDVDRLVAALRADGSHYVARGRCRNPLGRTRRERDSRDRTRSS